MASDIRAGAAFVELYVKGSFKKDLEDAQKKLKAFGDNLTSIGKKLIGVGAAIAAPLALAVTQFSNMGDALNKAAQRTGIAVETLSALKYAADGAGVSFEDFEGAIRKMQKALFDAEDGSKGAQTALASLSLHYQELKGLSPDRQFTLIAERLSQIGDVGVKASVAMELFGKGGAALLPLLDSGAAGINEMTRRAKELGLTISKDDADAASKWNDVMGDLLKQLKAVAFTVGAAVANALQPFAEGATRVMAAVIRWATAHRQLVVGLIAGAAAFIAAGAALVALGIAIKVILAIGTALAGIVGFISAAFAFLVTPVVLVTAAIIGFGVYFAKTSGVLGQFIDYIVGKFEELKTTALTTFGGIADALAAGDIQLAAQILWLGLQVAWAEGTKELHEKWINFKYQFVQVAVAAFYGALEIYQNVKAELIRAWDNTISIMGDIWDGFTSYFGDKWDAITSSVAKGILYVQSLFDGSDYESLAKSADDQLAQNKQDRDKAAQARIAQRAEQLEADLADVEAKRAAAVAKLDDEAQGIIGGANDAASEEINALDENKKRLEAQLAALRKQAATEKKKADESKPPVIDKDKFDTDALFSNRRGVENPAKSIGTFNASAIQGLQGNDAALEEQKKANATLKSIDKNTRNKALFG